MATGTDFRRGYLPPQERERARADEVVKDSIQLFAGLGLMYFFGNGYLGGLGVSLAWQAGGKLKDWLWTPDGFPRPAEILAGVAKKAFPSIRGFLERHKENLWCSSLGAVGGYGLMKVPLIGSSVELAFGYPPSAVAIATAFCGWVYADATKTPAAHDIERTFLPWTEGTTAMTDGITITTAPDGVMTMTTTRMAEPPQLPTFSHGS